MTVNRPFRNLKVGLVYGVKNLASQDLMLREAEGLVVRARGNPGGEERREGSGLRFCERAPGGSQGWGMSEGRCGQEGVDGIVV